MADMVSSSSSGRVASGAQSCRKSRKISGDFCRFVRLKQFPCQESSLKNMCPCLVGHKGAAQLSTLMTILDPGQSDSFEHKFKASDA